MKEILVQIKEGRFYIKSQSGKVIYTCSVDALLATGTKVSFNGPKLPASQELTKQDILDLGNAGFSLDDILQMQSIGWLDGRG